MSAKIRTRGRKGDMRKNRRMPVFYVRKEYTLKGMVIDTGIVLLSLFATFFFIDSRALAQLNCKEISGINLSDMPPFTSSGLAVVDYNQSGIETVSAYIRGTDDRIYSNIRETTGTWTFWGEVLGHGLTISEPAVIFYANILRIFVRGTDNGIWENEFDGRSWTGFFAVQGGGLTLSGPAAVNDSGTLKLFVRGLDNRIWENDF